MKKTLIFALFLIFGWSNLSNAQAKNQTKLSVNSEKNYKVTLYELGSVRCIPCQKMQPIIKSIKEKYKGQVQVFFYDVWTKEGKEAAKKFTFDMIPTQIFLDKDGKEFARHVGYFPEEELVKVLKQKGVK